LFEIFGDKKAALLAELSAEYRSELISAKIEDGPNFDPRVWYSEKMDLYKKRADAIQNEVVKKKTLSELKAEYNMQGGGYDAMSIIEEINNNDQYSEDEKRQMLIDLGER